MTSYGVTLQSRLVCLSSPAFMGVALLLWVMIIPNFGGLQDFVQWSVKANVLKRKLTIQRVNVRHPESRIHTYIHTYMVSQGCLFLGKPPNFIYRTRACFSSLSTLATGEGHESILYKAVCLQQSSIKPFLWTKCWLRLTASIRKQQRKINCSQAKRMACYTLSWLLHRYAFCQNMCPCSASFDMWDPLPPLPFFLFL